jgi:hypothetical protein
MTTHLEKFIPESSGESDRFGQSIALNDNYVVCCEPLYNSSEGRVVLFPIDNTSRTNLSGTDTVSGDKFADNVTINSANNIGVIAADRKSVV